MKVSTVAITQNGLYVTCFDGYSGKNPLVIYLGLIGADRKIYGYNGGDVYVYGDWIDNILSCLSLECTCL
jgi:hypothetical protein